MMLLTTAGQMCLCYLGGVLYGRGSWGIGVAPFCYCVAICWAYYEGAGMVRRVWRLPAYEPQR